MLISILIFVTLFVFGALAENYLAGGHIMNGSRPEVIGSIRATGPHNWWRIVIPAAGVGLMYGFTKIAPIWLVWIFFVLTICVIFHYVAWYRAEADQLEELAMFLPLFIVPSLALVKMGKILAASIANPFWGSVVGVVPWLFLMLVAGIVIVVFLWDIRRIVAVILAIALLAGSITTVALGVEWPKKANNTASNAEAIENEYGWHFYNLDLQEDNDEDNDFNFGPNPVDKSWTATDYDDDFRDRLAKDPALGAADIAWLDANVGTRFLGEFYESCEHDWAKTINAAKERWIENPSEYFKTLAAFFGYLNKAEISIAKKGNNITDQMYMNPYTTDTIPDVIVLKTKQQDGPFLVYTFTIKGNTFKVEYRIPCGYQPTNVKIVMGITPQSKPSKPSNGTGGGSTPESTTKPDKPEPTTKSKYNKDPSQSNNSGQNDDKGPGENTNTGGNKSSKEKDSNSNNLNSYDEYKEKIKEIQDANSGNGSNNSSNKPSTNGGSGTNVDSNADKANDPTPKSDKASEISGDQNAQAWDGPAD